MESWKRICRSCGVYRFRSAAISLWRSNSSTPPLASKYIWDRRESSSSYSSMSPSEYPGKVLECRTDGPHQIMQVLAYATATHVKLYGRCHLRLVEYGEKFLEVLRLRHELEFGPEFFAADLNLDVPVVTELGFLAEITGPFVKAAVVCI